MGRRVRDIEGQTGAQIHFEAEPQEIMVIFGSKEQRDAAWKIVQELIQSEEEVTFCMCVRARTRVSMCVGLLISALRSSYLCVC